MFIDMERNFISYLFFSLVTSRVSGRGNIFGSICLCVCLSVCVCVCLFALCRLNRWTYGPKIWHTH